MHAPPGSLAPISPLCFPFQHCRDRQPSRRQQEAAGGSRRQQEAAGWPAGWPAGPGPTHAYIQVLHEYSVLARYRAGKLQVQRGSRITVPRRMQTLVQGAGIGDFSLALSAKNEPAVRSLFFRIPLLRVRSPPLLVQGALFPSLPPRSCSLSLSLSLACGRLTPKSGKICKGANAWSMLVRSVGAVKEVARSMSAVLAGTLTKKQWGPTRLALFLFPCFPHLVRLVNDGMLVCVCVCV
jgi:hypothetical protein